MKEFIIPSYEEVKKKLKGPKGLRRTRSGKDGFCDFVWRTARFYSGIDAHMPVTCYDWIEEWCGYDFKQDKPSDLEEIIKVADDYAMRLCAYYELGYSGLARWARIMGGEIGK